MWKGADQQAAARDGDVLPLPTGQWPHQARPVPLHLSGVSGTGWAWQLCSARSPDDQRSPWQWIKSEICLGSQLWGPGSSSANPRCVWCNSGKDQDRFWTQTQLLRKGRIDLFFQQVYMAAPYQSWPPTSPTKLLQRQSLHSGPWHRSCYTGHWL